MFSWYVKKEDVRDVVKGQRIAVGIIWLAMAIVNYVMELLVAPTLSEIVEVTNASRTWISVLFLGGSLFMFFQEPDYSRVEKISKKYREKEMIKTRLLIDWRYEVLGITSAVAMTLYLIYTIVLPIYNVTKQF